MASLLGSLGQYTTLSRALGDDPPSAIPPSVSTWAHRVDPVNTAQAACWAASGEAQVRCQPVQCDAPNAKVLSHQLVKSIAAHHDFTSGTSAGLSGGPRPDQGSERCLRHQCDIALPGVIVGL